MTRRLPSLVAALVVFGVVLSSLSAVEAQGGRKHRKKKQPVAVATPEAPGGSPASPESAPPSPPPDAALLAIEPEILAYAIAPARAALARVRDPGAAGSLVAEGRVLTLEGSYGDAIARFDRAATAAPDDPAALVYKGEALQYARQEAGARAAFTEAKRRAQADLAGAESLDALYHLGVAQQRLGEHVAAFATLERARALAPGDARVLYQLGATRFLQERWQDAVDLTSQALERNPRHAYAYWLRGNAAGQIDRKDLLVNDLRRFVELAPNAPEAERARRILATVKG
jgi:tetratricopeptide (TPR) repeat protein